MPRKYFRKYLPTHQTITTNRWLGKFGTLLTHHNLWHLHRRSVAGGFAAGLFAGLIPGPFQALGATLLAILFKVNLPIAVVTTLYTNPLTIVPLYLLAYAIGAALLGAQGAMHTPPEFSWSEGLRSWVEAMAGWAGALGKPLLVGLPVLALLLAAAGYLLVRCLWRLHVAHAWRTRQQRRVMHSG